MRILRLIAILTVPLSLAFPLSALSQPTVTTVAQASTADPSKVQAAVRTALESANLSMRQKMQIKPMVQQYQSQTSGASAAQKKSAQEQFLKSIYGILTPAQQTQFKNSLKSSLGSSAP